MNSNSLLPTALFGGVLWGDNAVRFIFVDEAGTSGSPDENARVVAAVVINGDRELILAEGALAEAIAGVPKEFRDNFIFHAEDIMNNPRYRDRWRLTDRINLLLAVMSIPRRLGSPVCIGQCWSSSHDYLNYYLKGSLPLNETQHAQAFLYAIVRADKWIRAHGRVGEVGTIVCERSDMQKLLGLMPSIFRDNPLVMSPDGLTPTSKERAQGYTEQDGVFSIQRIRKTIHFVGKSDDPLVWIADACAYGMKRFFNNLSFGDQFCQAITGKLVDREDYSGPFSGCTFWTPLSE